MQAVRTGFCVVGVFAELAAIYLLIGTFQVLGFLVNGLVQAAWECSLVAVPCFLIATIGGTKDWLITVVLLVSPLVIGWALVFTLH